MISSLNIFQHILPIKLPHFLVRFLAYTCYDRYITKFSSLFSLVDNGDFIDELFMQLESSFIISDKEKNRIPAIGRVVIIANHPLGTLDGLILLKMILEVRSDVKVVANHLLEMIDPLKPYLLGVNLYSHESKRLLSQKITTALNSDNAVIFFPSGEVSRWTYHGIKDRKWSKGFLYFAKLTHSPILPCYIDGRNSSLFYILSFFSKDWSQLLLLREMVNYKKDIKVCIGELISSDHLNHVVNKEQIKLFRKHVYGLKYNKKSLFATLQNVAYPERPHAVLQEIKQGKYLGTTHDNKKIYLCKYQENSALLREIGRLRELTFRKVGEGTGKKRDIDRYDTYYDHLILWDDNELEIIGSYRLCISQNILTKYGKEGLYTHNLFLFRETFNYYLYNSVELGRSFIQPRFWGTRALDYLWQGIGAFLYAHPEIKTLFGAVSISHDFPLEAQHAIVYYVNHYYGSSLPLVDTKMPFIIPDDVTVMLGQLFLGNNAKEDMYRLKEYLKIFGRTIPPLYKHYIELVQEGGVQFAGFNIDPHFGYCVDGLLILDVGKIKSLKKERYIRSIEPS